MCEEKQKLPIIARFRNDLNWNVLLLLYIYFDNSILLLTIHVSFLCFGPVARSDARRTGIQEITGLILQSGNILSWRLVMNLSLPLIQGEQLSVTSERMYTKYWLTT